MGNTYSCCCSRPNTTATPSENVRQPLQPHKSGESSSAPSIRSIQNSIEEENTDEHIDQLIKKLDSVLLKIKGNGKDVSTSSGVEYFTSATKSASQVVDFISSKAQKISDMEIIPQELASDVTSLLDGIAGIHFMFMGLSLVTYTLDKYVKMKSNDSACNMLFEELIELAKEVKKFKEVVPGVNDKVRKALHEIAVGAVICCDYMERGRDARFWKAVGMESQLQKTRQTIQDLRSNLGFATNLYIAGCVGDIGRQIGKRSAPSPSELLDFQPEGIEDQVEDVKKLLDIGGSEQAIAVSIIGHGGMGKSTLAASVIQSLKLSSTDYKFSMVKIVQKTPDRRSQILQLQSDIIFHFTGDNLSLQDPQQGRRKLQAAMAGKSGFLYLDNVVDNYYIEELLPTDLLPQRPSEKKPETEKSEPEKKSESEKKPSEKSESDKKPSEKKSESDKSTEMHKTKIRILITSRQSDLKNLKNIKNIVHKFRDLPENTTGKLLSRTILQGDKPANDFDEEVKISELAEACRSVPLLLSVFGNHLKDNRKEDSYNKAIKALKEGNIDRYRPGYEEGLSETLLFVYDQMNDEDAQDAFLDICTYFHGWDWNEVADIVDSSTLTTLHSKMLVNKSETSTVIVHDILLVMGEKKAKDTRLRNFEDFLDIIDDESKLKSVKGMFLVDSTSLATLETRHLNAMRLSLRVLALGDWIRIDGPPCNTAFKNLRYLQVGDLKDFPFKELSKMEKLNVFSNGSKPGMDLARLSPNLKRLTHKIPYRDCNEFAKFPLKNMKSLKTIFVETERSVRLPEGFRLPASVENLKFSSCEHVPETLGHLSALQTLTLHKCDVKCFYQEFSHSTQLRYLSLQDCTDMISMPDKIFASLWSLRHLDLTGCTRLEKLPADLGTLTALQSLQIGKCENLRELPDNIGGLKSLNTLDLDGCIRLERLPESFGRLRLQHLTFQSLASLKELPQSIGNLSLLKSLKFKSCHSLEIFPESLVHLTNLEFLKVKDCIKLGALPKNFDNLCSLNKVVLSYCPLLTRLPEGFEAPKTLKFLNLENCSSLVDLPASLEMLSCLEQLYLIGLFFAILPKGLGKLNKLKLLSIQRCCKFQTLPQDFENMDTVESLDLWMCAMLEGSAMNTIVKLQNCHYVDISGSTMLIEQWNEMVEENQNLPMIVQTSFDLDEDEDLDRARRVGLFSGKCVQLDSTTKEFNHLPSLSIPYDTTIAVISLQLDRRQLFHQTVDTGNEKANKDQRRLFQKTVDMAKKRAAANCAGQMQIIYVFRRSDDCDNEEGETEKVRRTLMMLTEGIEDVLAFYAILSNDIRRLSLIGLTIFDNPDVFNAGNGIKFLCYMADVREDDEGYQSFEDGRCVEEGKIDNYTNSFKENDVSDEEEDEISENSDEETEASENSDEESENTDEIVEFINGICKSETQGESEECSGLPEENMVEEFIQTLKKKNIHHFSDEKVMVDQLQGKTVAIILIDQNDPECKRLIQTYQDIKLKDSNFEAIWIPLPEQEDFGFGTYSRAIQWMPWLTLENPKLINIDALKDKSPRVIIINSIGSIGNPNALSLLMSCGADAYPFTKESLSQIDLKSSLEILFHSTRIKLDVNNKLIFLYAEPPDQKLKMKRNLEKLVQIHGKGNFEIVYVGRFFAERNVAENLQKAYEDATQSMDWVKLSFEDMMTFWYRCKYLSEEEADEEVQETKSASTLREVVEALVDEERWLVVVDGNGIVTANGMDIVDMACELIDDKNDEVDIVMKGALAESLKEGRCKEVVRSYFYDELSHPQHQDHPMSLLSREELDWDWVICDGCCLKYDLTLCWKRIYWCDDCEWYLCWNCWKQFVKGEVRRQPTQTS